MSTIRSRTRRPAAMAAAMLTAAVLVSGCGGDADTTGEREATAVAPQPELAQDGQSRATGKADSGGSTAPGGSATGSQAQPALERAIIRTGSLTLKTADVLQLRQRVVTIVAGVRGVVATEETGTDGDGTVSRANLVLRVPTGSYDAAMRSLQGLGTVVDVRQESSDVTEQVVDVNSRVATQRAGLARMRTLLARANTIGEVISVETELTRREADLESLLARQKALAAQTELATITLALVRTGDEPPADTDERGFLHGLSNGWDAFTTAVSAVATGIGAAVPFLTLAGLLGVPAWLLLRRLRRASAPATPTTSDAS